MMITKLSVMGSSLGLIIERSLLEELKIDKDTRLELTVDGDALIIKPIRDEHQTRVQESVERLISQHADTLRKLAK